MDHIIISTYSTPTLVQKYINNRLEPLYFKLYSPISYTQIQNQVTFITYLFPRKLSKTSYVTLIAKGIVDFIQQEFSREYVASIIRNHNIFPFVEKEKMIQAPCKMEEDDETNKLVNAIKEEILEKNNLCIDGWIKFRLAAYKLYIEKKVERVIFEYLAYQEYKEFIELLKQFIKTQQSSIKILHLMPRYDGSIGLYDKKYKEITMRCLEEYTTISQINESCKEDMILSILLNMSPCKIRIHKGEAYQNQRLIHTIQAIYEDKVSLCKSCKRCEFVRDILTPKKL